MLTAELSVEPSTYGRSCAGTSATTTIQLADTATVTAPARVSRSSRRHRVPGADSRYTAASTGSTAHASSIFAWNAAPTQTPAASSGRSLPFPAARHVASAASSRHRVNAGSSTAVRNSPAVTGVTRNAAHATSAAFAPAQRRTRRNSTSSDATPSSTCGSTSVHAWNPSTRAASACGHRKPGVLSSVTLLPGSNEPKTNAFQLPVMLRAASA